MRGKRNTDAAIEAVRSALHGHCKDMPPDQYKSVLETLQADIEGHLEALKEEAEEGDDE